MDYEADSLVVFRNGEIRFGLAVSYVQRVIPACEVSPLPTAPAAVSGVITLAGEITAVIDPVAAFYTGETTCLTEASKFLLIKTARRELAIMTDGVEGVTSPGDTGRRSGYPLPANLAMLKEVIADTAGLIYIADPEALLSNADEARLGAAMLEVADG